MSSFTFMSVVLPAGLFFSETEEDLSKVSSFIPNLLVLKSKRHYSAILSDSGNSVWRNGAHLLSFQLCQHPCVRQYMLYFYDRCFHKCRRPFGDLHVRVTGSLLDYFTQLCTMCSVYTHICRVVSHNVFLSNWFMGNGI
jgi:hypothetical protein